MLPRKARNKLKKLKEKVGMLKARAALVKKDMPYLRIEIRKKEVMMDTLRLAASNDSIPYVDGTPYQSHEHNLWIKGNMFEVNRYYTIKIAKRWAYVDSASTKPHTMYGIEEEINNYNFFVFAPPNKREGILYAVCDGAQSGYFVFCSFCINGNHYFMYEKSNDQRSSLRMYPFPDEVEIWQD